MIETRYIAYYRVSTKTQSDSGLGLLAQERSVLDFLNGTPLHAAYTEVETGKGSNALDRRPQLKAALARCKKERCVLLLSRLDRLSRNVNFITSLMEAGVDFKIASMPHADKFMIQIYSVISELERDMIASRTKLSLAAAKARGVQLGRMGPSNLKRNIEERQAKADGFVLNLAPVLKGLQAQGMSQVKITEALNRMQVPTACGKQWSQPQVHRALARLARIEGEKTNDVSVATA